MNTKEEALKFADKLTNLSSLEPKVIKACEDMIRILVEELDKQSKPVAWMYKEDWDEIDFTKKHYKIVEVNTRRCFNDDIPLYTTPQTKPLSDDDIREVYGKDWHYQDGDFMRFARAIEAKVRGQ